MTSEFTVIGLNYTTAPLKLRETLCPRSHEAAGLQSSIKGDAGLQDVVVVSTCSRFEIYSSLDDSGVLALKEWFCRRAGGDLKASLYVHRGQEALRHLLRVASGLDSWVIGETEILGQVKAAYQQACAQATASRSIHLAFQRALFVGKKVRTETRIVGGINSIGGAASVLAQKIFSDLTDKRIMVIGAGSMAQSTVRHLCSKGIKGVVVANRSLDKAQELAESLGGQAMALHEGLTALYDVDIAIFSTGADEYLLDPASIAPLLARRAGRSLFLIDLGAPRNIDPAVAKVDGVYLYDLDSLRHVIAESLSARSSELPRAEAMVLDESNECWEKVSGVAVAFA
ncbi:MAG: glutamyl-tRNA reductase [Elusimicrobiota bacterium]